jgi:hypothetical protein
LRDPNALELLLSKLKSDEEEIAALLAVALKLQLVLPQRPKMHGLRPSRVAFVMVIEQHLISDLLHNTVHTIVAI